MSKFRSAWGPGKFQTLSRCTDKTAMAEKQPSEEMGDIVLGDQVMNYGAPETTTTSTTVAPPKKPNVLLKTLGIAALSAAVPGAAAIGYYLANRNQPDPQQVVVPAWEIGLETDGTEAGK